MRRIPVVLLFLLTLVSCDDNTFSPKADGFTERVVVYAVLDPNRETQMVRLSTNYDSPTVNPKDGPGPRQIANAEVHLAGNFLAIPFHDTLLVDGDGAVRRVWVANSGKFFEGGTYTLRVHAEDFDPVTATLKFPTHPFLYAKLVTIPGTNLTELEVGTGPQGDKAAVKGYLFRVDLTGIVDSAGVKRGISREVPYLIRGGGGIELREYPDVSREHSIRFPVNNIIDVYRRLELIDKATSIRVKVTGYAFEQNLYNYYFTVRGFKDPLSVRQDAPDFSSIPDGYGVFGALNTDTLYLRMSDIIGQ